MKIMVSAFPHAGDSYWRANHRWSSTPVEVTVLAQDDEGPAPADRPAYTITPTQLEQLRADRRIRIEDAHPAKGRRHEPSPEDAEKAKAEAAAKDAEAMNKAAGRK
jgi:hypothetical protein